MKHDIDPIYMYAKNVAPAQLELMNTIPTFVTWQIAEIIQTPVRQSKQLH